MKRNDLWVDGPRPDHTTLIPVEGLIPATHLSDHPLVGAQELNELMQGRLVAIGYDMEGVLAPFGKDEIPTKTMDWLQDDARVPNLGRFVITNCRDSQRVRKWRQQLDELNIQVHSPHVYKMDIGQSKLVVDKSQRKPSPAMYERALGSLYICGPLGASAVDSAFVGDKLSDTRGALAAGFGVAVLTPRNGEADHPGDKLVTRTKQLKKMNKAGVEFPS